MYITKTRCTRTTTTTAWRVIVMLDEVEGVDIDAPIDFSVAEHRKLTQILAEGK